MNCKEGGDQAQSWLIQLWQWNDYHGGDWVLIGLIGFLVVATLFCCFMHARESIREQQERDDEEELVEEMKLWDETEVWDD